MAEQVGSLEHFLLELELEEVATRGFEVATISAVVSGFFGKDFQKEWPRV